MVSGSHYSHLYSGFLHKFINEFLCYVVVFRASFLHSPDEFINEFLYHVVVLLVSSLDSPDKFVDEFLCYIVVLHVFFVDYLDKFISKLLYYILFFLGHPTFPHGTDGWHVNLKLQNSRKLTAMMYYCYHIMVRQNVLVLL